MLSAKTWTYLCAKETRPHTLYHIECANAEANVVEDSIRVFLVQLVEDLFQGETEARVTHLFKMARSIISSHEHWGRRHPSPPQQNGSLKIP
jgi:hypothetical protein